MKKIGLNTANIETKEAKCLWSWKKASTASSVRVSHYLLIQTSALYVVSPTLYVQRLILWDSGKKLKPPKDLWSHKLQPRFTYI